jgi:HAE1 family hydrophobic/amphiphilic exporter-1
VNSRLSELLPRFALKKPITVTMVMLSMAVLGGISWARIPLQLMPTGYDFPYLWLWVPYRNASPQEIERNIVQPLEDAVGTLPGLRKVESRAGSEYANLSLEFAQKTDMDEAWAGLVDRLERAVPSLPDDFEDYYIWRYNPDDEPVMWLAVTLPKTADDPAYLAETKVARALERVAGVARVEFNGSSRARVYVDFDRQALERHQVSLQRVMAALGADNFTLPGGDIADSGRRALVRSLATFGSVDDLRRYPIGDGLVLDDVARVVFARPAESSVHRVNGVDAASIDVYKESGSNTVDVTARLRDVLDELGRDKQLAGFEFHRFFDQGEVIRESLDNLRNSAIEGGLLAVLVLLIFLRRFGITFLVAASIPLSLMLTLVVMYLTGATINLLSLMGLMLSVGMVVDDSIVVIEAIQQRREAGEKPFPAALHGTAEVALAVVASTLTTVVVFLPIILMSGDAQFGFFMGQIGMPVCWALTASLFVALVLMPLATTVVAPGEPGKQGRLLDWVAARYDALVRLALRRRADAVVLAILALASSFWAAGRLERADEMNGDVVDFSVNLNFPASFSTREIDATLRDVERVYLDKKAEWRIRAVRARRWRSSSRGYVQVFLEKRQRGDIEKDAVVEAAKEILPKLPGVDARFGWGGGGQDRGNRITLVLTGDSSETLIELGNAVSERLRTVEGVLGVELETGERGIDELIVEVDREKASRYGVSPMTLARSVAFGFRGSMLRDIRIDGREVAVQAAFEEADRRDVDRLDAFPVWGETGTVPLAAVSERTVRRGFGEIRREDRRTSLGVTISMKGEGLEGAGDAIRAAMGAVELPRGYGWNLGRRFEDLEEQDEARQWALVLSICFVFLLMGMLFESFWLPLSVLFSIPFAFAGVYWMLWATRTTFEVMAGIGLVILVGIVVKNAIVLVDRVQQLRVAGMERDLAVVTGGRERLRPILMTAATTLVGLIPMAVGDTGLVGIPYYPLGRAVIGGLIASTALSLVLVPVLYTWLDDLKAMLLAGVLPRREAGT